MTNHRTPDWDLGARADWRAMVESVEHAGERAPQWTQYLYAAHRKVRIANYHLGQLRDALAESPTVATISVQAHFEGVILCYVAASDKVAEAVNLGLRLGLDRPDLRRVLHTVPRTWPSHEGLLRWHDAPIAADVRAIRRLAAHHHYQKTPRGDERIEVQPPPPGTAYPNSRELLEYCSAAVAHLGRLEPLLDELAGRFEPPLARRR